MERYIARRSEQKELAELINAYLEGRGNIVCVEVCVTQTHAQFAFQLASHMNQGLWCSGCGTGAAPKLCRLNAYPSMHLVESSPYEKIMESGICRQRPEHFNLSTALLHRALHLIRVSPPPPSTSPHLCHQSLALPPHSAALTPSRRPSFSALINLPSPWRPHSWCRTSQLFLLGLTTPFRALFQRLLPWDAPSINHASNSRAASLDLFLPSAHPLETLISISCLHSVS